jgi:hypothetical protein
MHAKGGAQSPHALWPWHVQYLEMRQAVLYVRKFGTMVRALHRDDAPLSEDELQALVAVFGELPAAPTAAAATVVADAEGEDGEADLDGDGDGDA